MTKLTYDITDFNNNTIKTDIQTYAEAQHEAEELNGLIKEVYIPIIQKYKRRSNLPISPEWKARHPES